MQYIYLVNKKQMLQSSIASESVISPRACRSASLSSHQLSPTRKRPRARCRVDLEKGGQH
jgi:hypothetical protein